VVLFGRRPCGHRRFGRAPGGDQGRGKICLHLPRRNSPARAFWTCEGARWPSVGTAITSTEVFKCGFVAQKSRFAVVSGLLKGFSLTLFSNVCAPAATAFWGELTIVVAISLGNRCSRTTVTRSGPSACLLRK
jgi:hypothetical protein